MPFVISKVATEVTAAVVIATTPVQSMHCEDTTPRFLGIKIGNEQKTCYSNVMPIPPQNFPTAGRVVYDKIVHYDIPVRVGGQW